VAEIDDHLAAVQNTLADLRRAQQTAKASVQFYEDMVIWSTQNAQGARGELLAACLAGADAASKLDQALNQSIPLATTLVAILIATPLR